MIKVAPLSGSIRTAIANAVALRAAKPYREAYDKIKALRQLDLLHCFIPPEDLAKLMDPAVRPFVKFDSSLCFTADDQGYASRVTYRFDHDMPLSLTSTWNGGYKTGSIPDGDRRVLAVSILHEINRVKDEAQEVEDNTRRDMLSVLNGFKNVKALLAAMPEVKEFVPPHLLDASAPQNALVSVEQIQKSRDMLQSLVTKTNEAAQEAVAA